MKRIAPALMLITILSGCYRTNSAPETSGIEGTVVRGPTCPVEQKGMQCDPQPIQTEVKIRDADGNAVTSVKSNRQGEFRVSLDPGSYVVEATGTGIAFSKPVTVEVIENEFTSVELVLDTGIR